MGQATRRGTFEQRKAQAIARRKREEEEERLEKAKIEAAKSPEQRLAEAKSKLKLQQLLSLSFGLKSSLFRSHMKL